MPTKRKTKKKPDRGEAPLRGGGKGHRSIIFFLDFGVSGLYTIEKTKERERDVMRRFGWKPLLGDCVGRGGTQKPHQGPLQLHTILTPPLTSADTGRITCVPCEAVFPVTFTWTPVPLKLDLSQSDALQCLPGDYTITAVDDSGSRAELNVCVAPALQHAVVIRGYHSGDASGSRIRDGWIEATGEGLSPTQRLLWTNGVETVGPRLEDVPPGVYAAVAVGCTCVHTCGPGIVRLQGME